LWYLNAEDEQLTVLRFNRVTFGINCRLFLLNGTIETHVERFIWSRDRSKDIRDVDDSTISMDNEKFKFYENSKAYMPAA